MTGLSLLAALLLLLLNAFFVLAEFAIVKVRSSRVEEVSRREGVDTSLVKHIAANIDSYLSAIQLGITMASLGIGWLGEPAVAHLLSPVIGDLPIAWARAASTTIAFAIAFCLITFLHVVLGEQVPKFIAIRRPTRATLLIALPLQAYYRAVYLPMTLLNWASESCLKWTGLRRPDPAESHHSDEELKILLASSQERGTMPLNRLLLFENLFDFGFMLVRDVMTPAERVAWLSLERAWAENFELVRSRKHTRYPLCGKGLDDILGVVHLKHVWISGGRGEPDLKALCRPALFVPEEAPLERVLVDLRQSRAHMALVRDKSGKIAGLITLENILEELVGEIRDEFEAPLPGTLSEAAVAGAVEIDLRRGEKLEVLQGLLKRLSEGRPDIVFQEAWQTVWRREEAFNSALGGGIALFHGRLPHLSKPALAFGRSTQGLDFSAADKKPVRLVFVLLTPIKEPGVHLSLLSRLAVLCSDDVLRRNLLRARNSGEVLEIFKAFDVSRLRDRKPVPPAKPAR